ncbi:triose-phosphate isomerase [Candidatus Woesearchaeota archaeon]|nr:triose-phosphate isomerase [Candidatus Woesearchaeota archaeon]
MKLPLYIINFKTYKEASGKNAVKLAKLCKKVASKKKASVLVAVQPADISDVAETGAKVIAQHVDAVEPGRYTGFVVPKDVKKQGAVGTLLNHSEHKLKFDVLKKTIKICRQNKLIVVACASTPAEAEKISKLKPDYIAIEPPSLIAGKVSVSKAKPEVITKTVRRIKKIPVLCGAGIHTREDVKIAFKLGAKGILVASGVVKAKNKEKELKELII